MLNENRLWSKSLLFLSICGLIFTFAYHIALIVYPLPTEFREAAPLITTQKMLQGVNPFAFSIQPEAVNVYGIVYHYFVYPFAYFFGNTLEVHRLVSGLFIIGSLVLMMLMLRRSRVNGTLIPLALLISYQAFLYSVTATVRPDSTGMFFMLLGIYIPYSRNFSLLAVFLGCLMGIIGFYSKPYFILGDCFLLVWLFLFRSKLLAIKSGILFGIAFGIIAYLVNKAYEAYFYNTYLVNKNVATYVFSHMFKQLVALVEYNFAVILLFVIFLIIRFRSILNGLKRLFLFNPLLKLNTPLLKGSISLWEVSFLLGMFLFIIKLGGHVGNSMIYIFQLSFPFMVLMIFDRISTMKWTPVFYGIAILNVFLAVYLNRWLVDTKENRASWARVAELVQSHNNILNSPAVAPVIFTQRKKVYDSGQNEYFHNSSRTHSSLFPLTDTIATLNERYVKGVTQDLAGKKFDMLLLPPEGSWLADLNYVNSYYRRVDSMEVYMPHARQHWMLVEWLPR